MWSLIKQLRIDGAFSAPPSRGGWLTVVVPSNSAWEKAQRDFSQAYTTLTQGGYPQYVSLNDPSSSKCKLKKSLNTFYEFVVQFSENIL
jgi:hypothetical protein